MDNQIGRLVADIVKKSEAIAKALKHGDVEIRKGPNGITVAEVKKTVVAR